MQRFVRSKWAKTAALLRNPILSKHIPETKKLTEEHLRELLGRYKTVYVKPFYGTWGKGVIRIDRLGYGYRFQTGTVPRQFPDFAGLYAHLRSVVKSKPYLVQQGIDLLKYNGRRFDLRVMVQKTPQHTWEATGIIGRVAHPRKIVTNFHNGGQLKALSTLMSSYMNASELAGFRQRLKRLGLSTALQLEKRYPGIKEIGVDVAVDGNFKPWILEVNTNPDPTIFKYLKNKRIYAKIRRYDLYYKRTARKR